MIKNLFLPVLLLLAACGGNRDDILVEVERPAGEVATALAGLDAHSATDIAMYQTQVHKAQDPNTLSFRFVAPKDGEHQVQPAEANIVFKLEEIAPGRTRIAVDVDVPQVAMETVGKGMVLSQGKVIVELKEALEAYAASVKSGSAPSMALEQVDYVFAAVALAMDKNAMENLASSQYGAMDFGDLMGDEGLYAADPTYGEPTEDAAPTTDTAYVEGAYSGESYSEESYSSDDGGWGAQ